MTIYRKLLVFSFYTICFSCFNQPVSAQHFSFLDEAQNAFVQSELNRLTLKQKIGQMTQITADLVCSGLPNKPQIPFEVNNDSLRRALVDYQVGSILNTPNGVYMVAAEWNEFMQRIQNMAIANGGIPVLYGIDAIHGPNYVDGATLFPQPLAMAATFNRDLARDCAEMCAYELKAASLPWNFSPALDVGRNPVWPRTWESFGEDVYLNTEMGIATVKGYQGESPVDNEHVAACLKHFTGYGIPFTGDDRTPAYLPERQLREYYLPQYQGTIDAGALTIMINSGEFNGIPAHANRWLLTDILRGELGFEGLLVSDWEDIHKLVEEHHVAADLKEAVRMAVMAGMDMSMTPITYDFCDLLLELVQEGSVSMSRIDESVARILAVKVALDLYEKSVWNPSDFPRFGSEEHADLSRLAAEESIVLLKNENEVLPLAADARVLVAGPTSNTMRSLNGGWTVSWQGEVADNHFGREQTIYEAMLQETNTGNVDFAIGPDYDDPDRDMSRLLNLSRRSDAIVLCLGELSYTEMEGNIDDLELPEWQLDMAEQLAATGKPLIIVLTEGRPRVFSKIEQLASAVVYASYPGPYGGEAIAGVLSGRVNPSAKLALTYPRQTNELVLYDHKFTEGPVHSSIDSNYYPQYEFGHGLSYTTFEYSNFEASSETFSGLEQLTLKVTVTNTGDRAGKHPILLFSQDEFATITPSVRRLRNFTKIELAPGESQEVSFAIDAADLAFIGYDMKPTTESGFFKFMLGDQVLRVEYVE
ncbi:MAG: glycoside hydrolase family 3 N-terminal domain-containing protein [Bacteroidota bacterium]